MNAEEGRLSAVLLLGPTGSGKTPLGDFLAAHGLWGRRCRHFDFGARLRDVAQSDRPPYGLAPADLATVRRALAAGALLEDREFPIAERILRGFLQEQRADAGDLVVLNGLPRHAGQAEDLAPILEIRRVVCLQCAPTVAAERIRRNSGGDRHGRPDDSEKEIAAKIELFHTRTAPLLDHYRKKGVGIETVEVAVDTTPEHIWRVLHDTRHAPAAPKAEPLVPRPPNP